MSATPKTQPVPSRISSNGDEKAIRDRFLERLKQMQWRSLITATPNDLYLALAFTIRDMIMSRAVSTEDTFIERGNLKMVCYLSAEFLMGPHLGNNLISLGLTDKVRAALAPAGVNLDQLLLQEEEPGLGNGGLGRLAACFLDSLATLEVPAIGYGIRYEFGIFDQDIKRRLAGRNHRQLAALRQPLGNRPARADLPGQVRRPHAADRRRERRVCRSDGFPSGCRRRRLRHAHRRATASTPATTCGSGRPRRSSRSTSMPSTTATTTAPSTTRSQSENITKVLYPNDERTPASSCASSSSTSSCRCALQDMLRLPPAAPDGPSTASTRFAVQLNDTHPAIGVAELMRLLVDEHHVPWDKAWEITQKTFGYTNHTLLPEALENWPVDALRQPAAAPPGDHLRDQPPLPGRGARPLPRRRRHSIRACRSSTRPARSDVRMAHLASVGSHAVNGVAGAALRAAQADRPARLLRDVAGEIQQQDQRRHAAPLAGAGQPRPVRADHQHTSATAGSTAPETICALLESCARIAEFRADWRAVKRPNKQRLAEYILATQQASQVDPTTLFDVQVKRIHEYKRQHLNLLHVIAALQPHPAESGLDWSRRARSSSAARRRRATRPPS